jgi:hypothetical protein
MAHAHRHVNYARMAGPGDWWTPPDDDGLTPCPVCDGDGVRYVLNESGKKERELCPACKGARFLDESGYPYKPQEEA